VRSFSVLVATLALLLGGSGPATAHASLVESDPADGASLETAPSEVTLTFSENVGNGQVAVAAPSGRQVETTNVRAVDHVLSADVASSDERGRYTVAYRIVSSDGHPISGELTFTTTTGRVVEQVDAADEQSFVHRHRGHLVLGLAVAVLAIGLILAPLRRRRDT
jgi:methionine-rich copper-binding protein CopC